MLSFSPDLSNFLEEITTELQNVYGNAQFSEMNTKYADQLMDMALAFGDLKTNAVRFCGHSESTSTQHERKLCVYVCVLFMLMFACVCVKTIIRPI